MKKLSLVCITIFFAVISYSQGCSDAGFCSVGNVEKDDTSDVYKHKISTIFTNGISDGNVFISTPALQYDYKINQHWAFQSKVAVNYAIGDLGSVFGLGDLYFSGMYKIEKKWKKSFMLGFKLPLNNGSLQVNDLSLPMQYQSSLGTFDLLTGVTFSNNHWLISSAFQQPLTGANKNEFATELWDSLSVAPFQSTNSFQRKGDVLLRFKYLFNVSEKLKMNAGLLGIYHLGKDSYKDINGNKTQIVGSDGITLNVTAALEYKFSKKFTFGLSTGFPLVIRDVRPDGLTRAFVISPELVFHL